MGLIERISATFQQRGEERNSIDWYIDNMLIPAATQFGFFGHTYQVGGLAQTAFGPATKEVAHSMSAYMAAIRSCPPAFAAQMVRAFILSQIRFTFRNPPWHPTTPRRTFGTKELAPLEEPWVNGTTAELVSKMEWHEGLTGNAYVYIRPGDLRVLRPDWVGILYGSQREQDDPAHAIDGKVIGYVYMQGGFLANKGRLETFLPNEIAHWSPLPDPESPGIGMSWMTPALRDMQGDRAATEHKLMFFKNAGTPNMVVKGMPSESLQKFNEAVDMIESKHTGLANAYRTLYLTAGADATVVGANLRQMDFALTQGRGETRVAMMSRIPAAILQVAEGLQGSALNAGNFTASRRTLVDTWAFPTMQSLAHCLGKCVKVPLDAEMWFDPNDMPILREDAKDMAEIASTDATTISGLVQAGFKPKTVIAAVTGRNMSLLEHDPRFISVQLQSLEKAGPAPGAAPNGGAPTPDGAQPAKLPAKEPAKLPPKTGGTK